MIIDLIAHKKLALRVLEVNLDTIDASCLWFEAGDASSRAAFLEYDFTSSDAKSLISAQTKHEAKRNSSFLMMNPNKDAFGLQKTAYDLVILKVAENATASMDRLVKNLKPLLSDEGHALFVQRRETIPGVEFDSGDHSPETPGTPEMLLESSTLPPGTPAKAKVPVLSKVEAAETQFLEFDPMIAVENHPWNPSKLEILTAASGFGPTLKIAADNNTSAYLCTPKAKTQDVEYPRDLCVARLAKDTPALIPSLRAVLEASGWKITEQTYPFSNPAAGSVVLILDELSAPVLTQASSDQWEALKMLISSGKNLLWVTKGAQYEVTEPDNALAHGLFRVVRMEDANAKLTTLDVQSSTSPATGLAIDTLLESLRGDRPKTFAETEFAERDGILYVHRIVPDTPINNFKNDEREGAEPVLRNMHEVEAAVALRAERLGTFQSLAWSETNVSEVPVEANKVEVEVVAVGVNFKDVAVSMGIVPENEYTLGYEAAGVIKRLGPGATKFKIGDRVCFLNNGSYANRLQVPVGRAHFIPNSMTFEDAATIPSVYLASMYSLFDIANLKQGQSVLIHSASGGVGLSCIQLAQYMNAEIYVTIGTEEKRKFLADNYGIRQNRMFSSRNINFAKEILRATNNRGIDVIINSLTGEMLDKSWRVCAHGGTLVEIGKKDIIDRNMLSMEPFDRNCSFRAMDFSYTKDISDSLITRLLDQIFDLVDAGHIKPIHPVTIFGFDDIPSALAYIRSGRHIGKVVISNRDKTDVQIPIRPAMRKLALRSDASYLIVGGLKGLCGNLAIHMAQHGARRIIVCSRSGISDEASKKTVMNCLAYGCEIVEGRGDVADIEFMRRVFKGASPRITGVIQGAMILRDKPYETMTLEEYHTAIYGKISGAWSLHRPLDFFTMLSSISGIVGKKGQANYSAANTFLDAFATYRQSLGCRANAVDLGLIEDVGYVAEQGGMDSHFNKRQWTPVTEGTLRKILSYSILQQTAPIHASSSAASSGAGKEGSQGDQTIRAFLMMHKSGADKAALVKVGVELMAAQFTKILRLETDMEPGKSLMAYGLDSLAAVELRNWIRMELGAELTMLDITNASSLITLCEKLVSKLPQPETVS
ncbi:MAG: hypothetical protein Q9187_002242 [Circinaria calcarea]